MVALRAVFNPEESGGDSAHHRRLLAEYKNRRAAYEEFCVAVHKVLDLFLKERGYRYQIVYRTKAPEKLREKLIRKTSQGIKYKQLGDIEDLAGLRVVFYSEKDKERFVKEIKKEISGAIRVEERVKDGGYNATHLIASFGPKRLQLSEYKHFEDMKSEIQVTSVLRHAWSEIEHDLIYKDIRGLKQRDPEKFAKMNKKLKLILEKYINKASEEFEKIMDEIID